MLFRGRKKRIERPKSVLGYALYRFDNIYAKKIKKIVESVEAGKKLKPRKINSITQKTFNDFDKILDSLSVENFKTDYRSDKIRYRIISMINSLKNVFTEMKSLDYDPSQMEQSRIPKTFEEIADSRKQISEKMKDIEGDYL